MCPARRVRGTGVVFRNSVKHVNGVRRYQPLSRDVTSFLSPTLSYGVNDSIAVVTDVPTMESVKVTAVFW
jgi:hypothetical protein